MNNNTPAAAPQGSLWRALRTELFPGARSRRWKAALAQAQLPAPLASLCETVISRTRLHASEKSEVARELAGHFRDGLDAGRSPEQLARDFGDPRAAALLIRRGMKRKRSILWRGGVRVLQATAAVVALALGLTVCLCARTWLSHPTITRNFYAEYDGRFSRTPDAHRAWPLYLESFALAPALPRELGADFPGVAKASPQWPLAIAHNAAMQPTLEKVRAAAARQTFDAPLSTGNVPELVDYLVRDPDGGKPTSADPAATNEPVFTALMPHLGTMRRFARELRFDASLAMEAGDADRVSADLGAMIGMANHLDQQHVLIASLVSQAMFSLCLDAVREAVALHPDLLSDQHLVTLAHALSAYPNGAGSPRAHLDGERAFLEDILQRAYTDDGRGDGHPTREGLRLLRDMHTERDTSTDPHDLMYLAPISLMASRQDVRTFALRQFDRAERAMATPLWERDDSLDGEIEAMSEDPLLKVRYILASVFMPSLHRVSVVSEITKLNRDGVLTGIALELYRRKNGVYPESLAALVPGLLPEIPRDRFDGQPIRYSLVGGKPLVYSVASDYEDNGGAEDPDGSRMPGRWIPRRQADAMSPQDRHAARLDLKYDWVLWPAPPVRDEPPAPRPPSSPGF